MSEKKPPHCIEGGCRLPVAEESAAWCERHEAKRQEQITRQLEGIKARLEELEGRLEEREEDDAPLDKVQALISCEGDPSVGIPGLSVTVPVGAAEIGRAEVRACLAACWSKIWGEPARVEFSDEIEAQNAAEAAIAERWRRLEEAEEGGET